jgi:hypothetical protein
MTRKSPSSTRPSTSRSCRRSARPSPRSRRGRTSKRSRTRSPRRLAGRADWGTDQFGPAMQRRGPGQSFLSPPGSDRMARQESRKAEEAVKKGFPNLEPWQRYFNVHVEFRHASSSTGARGPRDNHVGRYKTREDAEALPRSSILRGARQGGRRRKARSPSARTSTRSSATGPDVRQERDVAAEDFVKDFGFRGVEFGNWVAGDERQKSVNLAYDALHDLARVFDVPPKALSLNGTLGVGVRRARPRRQGGGALRAELSRHQPDETLRRRHARARMGARARPLPRRGGQPNAYGGAPKSISGWDNTKSTRTPMPGGGWNLSPRLRAPPTPSCRRCTTSRRPTIRRRRAEGMEKHGTRGLKSWQDEAERVRDLMRKGQGNTRS